LLGSLLFLSGVFFLLFFVSRCTPTPLLVPYHRAFFLLTPLEFLFHLLDLFFGLSFSRGEMPPAICFRVFPCFPTARPLFSCPSVKVWDLRSSFPCLTPELLLVCLAKLPRFIPRASRLFIEFLVLFPRTTKFLNIQEPPYLHPFPLPKTPNVLLLTETSLLFLHRPPRRGASPSYLPKFLRSFFFDLDNTFMRYSNF